LKLKIQFILYSLIKIKNKNKRYSGIKIYLYAERKYKTVLTKYVGLTAV